MGQIEEREEEWEHLPPPPSQNISVRWGLGPSGHLIRLLTQTEHLPCHLALSSSRQGYPGLLAHLLDASGLQGSRENESPLIAWAVCQAALCVPSQVRLRNMSLTL